MFQIIKSALRKPISVLVAVLGIVFFAVLSLFRIPVDIFPSLDLPRIFIVQTYGGMAADEMDAFVATKYRDHFLYVSGIKNVEIKTIQRSEERRVGKERRSSMSRGTHRKNKKKNR